MLQSNRAPSCSLLRSATEPDMCCATCEQITARLRQSASEEFPSNLWLVIQTVETTPALQPAIALGGNGRYEHAERQVELGEPHTEINAPCARVYGVPARGMQRELHPCERTWFQASLVT
uniref:Uncharacterized protein n=1 Tax=Pyrodinium bahamense TaxID=73915 RepID=A0A7S0FCD8_9DINO